MTRTFLITAAQDARDASALGLPCGFLCYRIGPQGTLQRSSLPLSARGGLMGIVDAPDLSSADPALLARRILAECSRRGYGGVILDLPDADLSHPTLTALAAALDKRHLPLFLPRALADAAPGCRVILPGLVSGGTFDGMLDCYIARYGAARICLDLQRSCHRFSIPSADPDGCRLTRQALQALLDRHQPKVFFSPELCTRYFTYRPRDEALQFVLFDDPETGRHKLHRAAARGIHSFFLLYSEWGRSVRAIAGRSAGT